MTTTASDTAALTGCAPPAADVGVAQRLGVDLSSEASLRSFVRSLPGVDAAMVGERCAALATRSLKLDTKLWALDTALRMCDLTSLEATDTPARIRQLCSKALRPDVNFADTPQVAAVCVYPDLVATAVEVLAGSDVKVASVAGAFPSGRSSLKVKLADVADAVEAGADEIDMVIDRAALLAGQYGKLVEDVVQVKQACGDVHLKVILETGELGTLDQVRRASWLTLAAGAGFIKTSTGKVTPAATPAAVAVMLQAVADLADETGKLRGVKAAGGIRTAKDALRYLVLVREVAGEAWVTPELFRFGASTLVDDLLMQRAKQRTGRYWSPDRIAAS